MYIYISISLSLSLSPGSDPWQGYKGFRVPNGTDHEGAMASSTHPSSSWCCFCGLTREFQIKGTLLQDSPKTILFQGHLNSPTPSDPPWLLSPEERWYFQLLRSEIREPSCFPRGRCGTMGGFAHPWSTWDAILVQGPVCVTEDLDGFINGRFRFSCCSLNNKWRIYGFLPHSPCTENRLNW